MSKPRRGRPPIRPHLRRDSTLHVAVTAEELAVIREATATSGLTVSEYVRMQVLPQHVAARPGARMKVFRVPEWERNMMRTWAQLDDVSLGEYRRSHALINVKANHPDLWSPRNCGYAWHDYAYKTDEPTEHESRIPATCPSCGLEAPLVIDHGDGRYEVELPGLREGEGDASE